MKLAEALLLRKQLQEKVDQLKPLKLNGDQGVYRDEVKRVNVNEQTDDIVMRVARITVEDITKTYDMYASELRKLDTAIQAANWKYDIEFEPATKL